MKKVLILPTYLSQRVKKWPYIQLFYTIRDEFGFELRFDDCIRNPESIDELFLWGMPYHNRPHIIEGFNNIRKDAILYLHTGDIQCYDSKECYENKLRVFDRCDKIFSPTYSFFKEMYVEFLDKFVYLPTCFSPHKRYVNLKFNENPIRKCLLSGSFNKNYPLRFYVKNNLNEDIVCIPKGKGPVEDEYARLLNSYYCCIASTGGGHDTVLSKFFEIPAAGSLLLVDRGNDMDELGFIPNKHYIPIDKHNVFDIIDDCLKHPDKYNDIRREGMNFVRSNHSIRNRISILKENLRDE